MASQIIEKWWRGLGCWDRYNVCYIKYDGNIGEYLDKTDDWWDSKTTKEKEELYNEFFEEL